MKFLAGVFALLFFCALVPVPRARAETLADLTQASALTAEALKARTAGRAAEYLEKMQAAFRRRPNMPGIMMRLAGAHSINGETEKSIALLTRVSRMGLAFDLADDADFAGMRNDTRYLAVMKKMSASLEPLIGSETAFELPQRDFLPEGLAYDGTSRAFYLASVHQRKIVKRAWNGNITTLGDAADGLWSVLSISVDATRRVVWATTAAIDQTRNVDAMELGRTAVFKYDLDSEVLLARFELPRTSIPRVFGDLLLAANGDAYISESREGGIYRIAGGKLETFIAPGTFASPQGMVWLDGGKWLLVADYSLGLFRVNMRTKAAEWLPPPADGCLLGLDALVRYGDKIIATQNGIRPNRVVEIAMAPDGQVTSVTTLEASHPRHREPTLGVVVGDDFYYVANSQWDAFERGKPPPVERLGGPLILRLPLASKSAPDAKP